MHLTPIGIMFALIYSHAMASPPGNFSSVDIGAQLPAGQTIVTNGGYNISSATGDIWAAADDARFVYQQVSGDFDIRARLASFTGAAFWSKAGLMVRSDLGDSAANGFMVATRSAGWGRYMFTARLAEDYNSYVYSQGSFERVQYPNTWLRLVRFGNTVIPMHSTNGINWTQIGNLIMTQLPRSVPVGMAVSNHPESGAARATAQFRDVSFDVGIPLAPVVLSDPYSEIVNPGADVTVNVSAIGRGTLRYQWFRNDQPIEGATNAAYTVQALQEGDDARFSCQVRNEFGQVQSVTASIEVKGAGEPFDGILLERFNGVHGRRIEYLLSATNYPGAPSSTVRPNLLELTGLAEDAGARLRGYVTAPLTGDYYFYIASDDRGELWLSTDDNPANKRYIAQCYYWVNARQWDYYDGQVSNPIRLQAGRRYYLEALVKGEGAPNHGAVAWELPNGVFEGPIPASRFAGAAPRFQSVAKAPDGGFEIALGGTANTLYVVQASTNLIDWMPILTNRAPFTFFDVGGASRFFRATSSR